MSTGVDVVRDALRRGDVTGAVEAWGGNVLAPADGTDAPDLRSVDDELAVAVREAVLAERDPELALRYGDRDGADPLVAEQALADLEGRERRARAVLVAGSRAR